MINIYEDKILYDAAKYVSDKLRLKVVDIISDHIGKKGYIFSDTQKRLYYFACKRKMCFSKGKNGIISFSKDIVREALVKKCILLMYIEDKKEDGIKGDYIYMFDPKTILTAKDSWTNEFNEQEMLNFDIKYCLNIETTRAREPIKIEYDFNKEEEMMQKINADIKKEKKKGETLITLRRFI